jgi:pimeloyl-ACP methyl ester carboxylesterase
MLEITDTPVTVAGGSLNVARLHAGGDAPVAIAVHGITSSSRAWLAVARALDGRAALLAVDLRGRGESRGLPGPYGLGSHVSDLLAVLDSAGLERAVLVGHSLGAYVVARFAVEHPQRVRAILMVDGGLDIPGAGGVEPQAFADALLGPALARLQMRFESDQAYYEWWRTHPALGGSEVEDADLFAYAAHDLVGEPPDLRPGISEDAVRADVLGLVDTRYAHELVVPARMLVAPRGLADEPSPMQPLAEAGAWVDEDPVRRTAELVPGANHYTITIGRAGAARVADEIARIGSA